MKYLAMICISIFSITHTFAYSDHTNMNLMASEQELAMVTLVNEYRVRQGLEPLKLLNLAIVESREHSDYMAFTLRGLTHDDFKVRIQSIESGLQQTVYAAAENVAYNFSILAAHKALLLSPGHLKNIEGDYSHMGIGIVVDEESRLFVTQIFIKIL